MSLTISQETYNLALAAHLAGDLTGAYQILADGGDVYAKAAAGIVDGTFDIFEATVRSLWEDIDPGSVDQKWIDVATQHQKQYLNLILSAPDGKGGYMLPNTNQIENSYLDAVDLNGLPPEAAIDVVINTLTVPFEQKLGFDIPGEWFDVLGLEAERLSTEQEVISGMSAKDALATIVEAGFLPGTHILLDWYTKFSDLIGVKSPGGYVVDQALKWLDSLVESEIDDLMSNGKTESCFPAGTLIAMADGSEKAIEDIAVGDEVLSFNEHGDLAPAPVTQLLDNVTTEWLKLSNGTVVTPGHRYLRPDGSFEEIAKTIAGDGRIVAKDGEVQMHMAA